MTRIRGRLSRWSHTPIGRVQSTQFALGSSAFEESGTALSCPVPSAPSLGRIDLLLGIFGPIWNSEGLFWALWGIAGHAPDAIA